MKTYEGQCHCGNVKFELTSEQPIESGIRCNCSLCRRKAAVMLLVDHAQFKLVEGEASLSNYQWNTKLASHYFCSNCGIYTHHQPRTLPDKTGVNLACFDELDPVAFENIDMRNGSGLSIDS